MESFNLTGKTMFENNLGINKKITRGHTLMNKITIKQLNFIYEDYASINKRKKSFDFTQKKYNIKDVEESPIIKRKYTIENYLTIKNFVPQLKPIEGKISPSKLRLNKKEKISFFHKSHNNLIIKENHTFNSCPNSEEECDSEYNSSENMLIILQKNKKKEKKKEKIFENLKKSNIQQERKKLHRSKNVEIRKCYSRKNTLMKEKLKNKYKLDYSSGSDLNDEEYNKYLQARKGFNGNHKKEKNVRNRINSSSILNVLEKKFKLDE
jgi:hypothetical protein